MARILTASRASVAPQAESAYRQAVERLGTLRRAGGERFWVFQSRSRPGEYLEFCERSDGGPTVRSDREGPLGAAELEVRALARYAADAWDVWEEMR